MNKPFESFNHQSIGEFIKSRRTVNFFKQRAVPDALILEAIDVARWAPNHKKTEPWHFHILGSESRKKTIALITAIKSKGKGDAMEASIRKRMEDIPGWFVLTVALSDNRIQQQEDYAACCCAAQNLMLFLWDKGVGVKWTTGLVTRDARFFDLLEIDKNLRKVVGLFWYGYPDHQPAQDRRPVDDIVTKLD